MKPMRAYAKLRRRIPLFPLIPIVPAGLLLADTIAAVALFVKLRRLESRVQPHGAHAAIG